MFKRYPDSYRLPVYDRRSAAMPQHVYDAAARNATQTQLVRGGNGLENFEKAIAFPIPKDGLEVIWNHITRYRGGSARRVVAQATPQVNGNFSLVKFVDEVVYTDTLTDYKPEKHGNVLFYFKQQVTEPSRRQRAAGARNPGPGEGTAHGVDLQRRPAPRAPRPAGRL